MRTCSTAANHNGSGQNPCAESAIRHNSLDIAAAGSSSGIHLYIIVYNSHGPHRKIFRRRITAELSRYYDSMGIGVCTGNQPVAIDSYRWSRLE